MWLYSFTLQLNHAASYYDSLNMHYNMNYWLALFSRLHQQRESGLVSIACTPTPTPIYMHSHKQEDVAIEAKIHKNFN